MKDLRIVFMGTPHFAVGVLQKLVEHSFNIAGVITAPDKPAGRGRKLSQSAVKEYALSQNLPVLQPTNLKDPHFLKELEALHPNLFIVVAFRMLPKVVWQLPEQGTFNLHASLLPQYRGAAPINWAVMNGEAETGVTTFFIDEKIDTGAIIASETVAIEARETAGSLHDKLMDVGSDLVVRTVQLIQEGKATPQPQPTAESLKEAPKLTSENTQINWQQPAAKIDAFIRGLSPYPTAWTQLRNGEEEWKVKIYDTKLSEEKSTAAPGTLMATKKELKVATQDNNLYIETLQLPGKKKMPARDLLNGFTVAEGAQFV